MSNKLDIYRPNIAIQHFYDSQRGLKNDVNGTVYSSIGEQRELIGNRCYKFSGSQSITSNEVISDYTSFEFYIKITSKNTEFESIIGSVEGIQLRLLQGVLIFRYKGGTDYPLKLLQNQWNFIKLSVNSELKNLLIQVNEADVKTFSYQNELLLPILIGGYSGQFFNGYFKGLTIRKNEDIIYQLKCEEGAGEIAYNAKGSETHPTINLNGGLEADFHVIDENCPINFGDFEGWNTSKYIQIDSSTIDDNQNTIQKALNFSSTYVFYEESHEKTVIGVNIDYINKYSKNKIQVKHTFAINNDLRQDKSFNPSYITDFDINNYNLYEDENLKGFINDGYIGLTPLTKEITDNQIILEKLSIPFTGASDKKIEVDYELFQDGTISQFIQIEADLIVGTTTNSTLIRQDGFKTTSIIDVSRNVRWKNVIETYKKVVQNPETAEFEFLKSEYSPDFTSYGQHLECSIFHFILKTAYEYATNIDIITLPELCQKLLNETNISDYLKANTVEELIDNFRNWALSYDDYFLSFTDNEKGLKEWFELVEENCKDISYYNNEYENNIINQWAYSGNTGIYFRMTNYFYTQGRTKSILNGISSQGSFVKGYKFPLNRTVYLNVRIGRVTCKIYSISVDGEILIPSKNKQVDCFDQPLLQKGQAAFNAQLEGEALTVFEEKDYLPNNLMLNLDPKNVLNLPNKIFEQNGDKIKGREVAQGYNDIITTNIEAKDGSYTRDDLCYGESETAICKPDYSFQDAEGKPATNIEEINTQGIEIRRLRNFLK